MEFVELPSHLVDELFARAKRSPKEEICGLLAGKGGRFTRCYPEMNIARNKRQRFEMEPEGQIDAFRKMRERGEVLLGIYHSHPNGPAHPSSIDLSRHEYLDVLYLVISLEGPVTPELRGFRIENGQAREVSIGIT